jgi:hypothetical protein
MPEDGIIILGENPFATYFEGFSDKPDFQMYLNKEILPDGSDERSCITYGPRLCRWIYLDYLVNAYEHTKNLAKDYVDMDDYYNVDEVPYNSFCFNLGCDMTNDMCTFKEGDTEYVQKKLVPHLREAYDGYIGYGIKGDFVGTLDLLLLDKNSKFPCGGMTLRITNEPDDEDD